MTKRISDVFFAIALWMLAIFLLVRLAHAAESLQVVQAPADLTGAFLVVGFILLIAAGVYAYRRWPSQSAKADAEVKADLAKALSDLRVFLATKLGPAAAPQDAPAPVEAVVVPPAGKSGVAGVLSLPVTGDPAIDLPAITAAYYAKG